MKSKAIYLLGFICLFFFVLSVSIAITISFMPLYAFDIEYLNIANRIEMTKEILLKNYSILLNYLTIPWITELEMPNFPSSKKGLFHFSEVKKLFLLDYIILLFSGIGSFSFLNYLKKEASFGILVVSFDGDHG
ncbi:integral membrane protein TIGR01906 [Carnobacterium iners]|nr:integral membrane protein TIGR01906 [Carnobacterium iners]